MSKKRNRHSRTAEQTPNQAPAEKVSRQAPITEAAPAKTSPRRSPVEKRLNLRKQYWPDADGEIWNRKERDGYTTIPRVLSLVAHLIKTLSDSGDPSKAYIELWCQSYDEMIITIDDEERHAFAAGYASSRGARTWREHVWQLEKLGFVRIKPEGNHDIGHVLLIDPYLACAKLNKAHKVDQAWWNAFVRLVSGSGAVIPDV